MSMSVSAAPTLLDVLQGFVHELRAAGLPVSMTENLDAMRAIEHVHIDDRELFKGILEGAKRRWKFNQSPLFLQANRIGNPRLVGARLQAHPGTAVAGVFDRYRFTEDSPRRRFRT